MGEQRDRALDHEIAIIHVENDAGNSEVPFPGTG